MIIIIIFLFNSYNYIKTKYYTDLNARTYIYNNNIHAYYIFFILYVNICMYARAHKYINTFIFQNANINCIIISNNNINFPAN